MKLIKLSDNINGRIRFNIVGVKGFYAKRKFKSRGWGVKNRAQAMRNKYGDDFYLAQRPRKHRYVFIVGSKKYKKKIKAALRYGIAPYPKAA